MTFTVKDWRDGPVDTSTPLSAAALEDMETRLSTYTDSRTGPGRTVSGGKSVIPNAETRTGTAYGLMATPDRVSGVTLPNDGLLAVAYQATWQGSTANAANAAIFLGSNQLKIVKNDNAAPAVQEATIPSTAATNFGLATAPHGLHSEGGATGYAGDVATGQVVGMTDNAFGPYGGVCYVFAGAGSYDVSVQFKASSGSVAVQNRRLWVWAIDFSA